MNANLSAMHGRWRARRLWWLLGVALAAGCAARPSPFSRASVYSELRERYPAVRLPPATPPAGIALHEGLPYVTRADRELLLDVYRPRAPLPLPAVLVVHGGGWERGDRSMERPFAQQLAARGFVTATVEYRLGEPGRFPNALFDLKAAVRWLRRHASAYGIDPGRIAALGGSSGGHLVALLGATNGVARFEGDSAVESSSVGAVVDIDGLVDFTGQALLDKELRTPGAPTRFLGGPFATRADVWRDASPLTHAGPNSAAMLFINSTAPTPILPGRPEMCRALLAQQIPCETTVLANTPHPFWLVSPWFETTLDRAARFLQARLAQTEPGKKSASSEPDDP